MADEQQNAGGLPPRLDLRKSGSASPKTAETATPAQSSPAVKPASLTPGPAAVKPAMAPAASPVAAKPAAAPVAAPTPTVTQPSSPKPVLAAAPASLTPGPAAVKPAMAPAASPVAAKPAAAPVAASPIAEPAGVKKPTLRMSPVPTGGKMKTVALKPGQAKPAAAAASAAAPVKAAAAPAGAAPKAVATPKPVANLGSPPSPTAKTVRLKPAGAAVGKVAALKPAGAPAAKTATSKVPLEAAKMPSDSALTIKRPAVKKAAAAAEALGDSKRKTSRIALDSVLAATDAGQPEAPSTGPKTIKLKRPSEAVTVKAVRKGPATASAGASSKTAPMDEAAAAATPSGKRTVKVRKPTMKVKSKAAKAGVGAAAPAKAAAVKEVPYVDSAHWLFVTFAVFAVLVVSVTVWMYTSQVIGPNYCLTQTTYSQPEIPTDLHLQGATYLPWPGKLRQGPQR